MKKQITDLSGTQGFKAAVLIVLTLIMLIPISMVKSLIFERSHRAYQVREEIADTAGGRLKFAGPVIRIPGTRELERSYVDTDGKKAREIYEQEFVIWMPADKLEVRAALDTENKFRGIFNGSIFTGEIELTGLFDFSELESELEDNESIAADKAEIVIPFFNQRGIRSITRAVWNGGKVSLNSGKRVLGFDSAGVWAPAPFDSSAKTVDFNFAFSVRGAGSVSILPLAGESLISMGADWASPSFSGFCLPDEHSIGDSGFTAEWSFSSLSSGLPMKWSGKDVFEYRRLEDAFITTDFISIHDHYEQNERAAKYAVLFILLPFITLFLFEHFFSCRLHFVQYILAGIANVIFYLLLLSLSEHLSFNLSYLISALSVSLMLCLYTFSILRKNRKAWFMAPVMAAVYLFLFVTLQSEDWALLIGAGGVFAVTAVIMFITRNIDFYKN